MFYCIFINKNFLQAENLFYFFEKVFFASIGKLHRTLISLCFDFDHLIYLSEFDEKKEKMKNEKEPEKKQKQIKNQFIFFKII